MVNDGKLYEWKCTVCGEIIRGNEVPETCPVCGVNSNYFIKLEKNDLTFLSSEHKTFIVIGSSAAGMSAMEEIRKRNSICDITLISKESVYGYYRPQLSKILGQDIDYSKIFIKDYDWFKRNNVDVMLGKSVVEINSREKTILLDSGLIKEYDKLIIATGAECFMPPISGSSKEGVFTLRYLKDATAIKEYAKNVKTATVIGGGVLGLETASEFKKLGLDVTIVELSGRILPRQLDEAASEILENIILKNGVKLEKNASVVEIIGGSKASGFKLKSGKIVNSELIVVSAGVRANIKLADDIGMNVNKAIVVNDMMKTSINDIYACGDCCEHNGINYALWSEAVEQGKTAGINAVGDISAYKSIIPSTTINIFNTSIFSVGDVGSNLSDHYDTKEEKDTEKDTYKKLFYKNDILVGAILIGDTRTSKDLLEALGK